VQAFMKNEKIEISEQNALDFSSYFSALKDKNKIYYETLNKNIENYLNSSKE